MELQEKCTTQERIKQLKENIQTEEATNSHLFYHFFRLGYDVFNPLEFIPEFTADVGIKKEKSTMLYCKKVSH
ncbi:MAG: hypothetical protein ACLRQF_17385 [Thomasclavelia ramosa]